MANVTVVLFGLNVLVMPHFYCIVHILSIYYHCYTRFMGASENEKKSSSSHEAGEVVGEGSSQNGLGTREETFSI